MKEKLLFIRRMVGFPLLAMVLELAVVALALFCLGGIASLVPEAPQSAWAVVRALLIAGGAAGAYFVACNFIEGVPCRDLDPRGAGREWAAGWLVGALLFAAVVAIVWLAGAYRIDGVNGWATIWGMMAMAIVSGVVEEILFRGILFRHLESLLGSGIALALSGLSFGLMHLMNPHASFTAGLAIAVEAGLMLGALYMLTRRLWAAIGLHMSWNFFQGWAFGLPVSGGEGAGYVRGVLTGPEWLTGGAFGLEASVVALAICTAAGIAILLLARRRGRWMPPIWSRVRAEPAGTA